MPLADEVELLAVGNELVKQKVGSGPTRPASLHGELAALTMALGGVL